MDFSLQFRHWLDAAASQTSADIAAFSFNLYEPALVPGVKFGMELKMGIGLPNVFLDDQTRFSSPIQSLRTKTWVLSFTFEG